MKVCKYCGRENKSDVITCFSCGGNEFMNKCNNCGNIFEGGNYCTRCGVRANAEPQKCFNCATEYYSNACPNCGYTARNQSCNTHTEPVFVAPDAKSVKKRKTGLWVLGWIFIFPIPLTILMVRNKKINKWLRFSIIAVAWIVYLAIGLSGNDNLNTSDWFPQSSTEESSAQNDNLYANNEKDIRQFIEAYNKQYEIDINSIAWKKNHQIANVDFGDKTGYLNSTENVGFLVRFEFDNGKKLVSEYDTLVKNIIKIFEPTLSDSEINASLQNAKKKNSQTIVIEKNISLYYDYAEKPVGFRAGDSYIIEITSSNYGG